MTFPNRPTVTFALFGVLAVVLITVFFAIPGTASKAAISHAKASRRLTSDFRVFRRVERRPRLDGANSAPAIVTERLSNFVSLFPGFGLKPAQVVGVPEGTAGEVWLLPGAEGGCEIFAATVSDSSEEALTSTCFKTAIALTGNAIGSSYINGTYYTWGLVPNGDADVTVTSFGGASTRVPVASNVAFGVTQGRPATWTLKDATGQSVTVGQP